MVETPGRIRNLAMLLDFVSGDPFKLLEMVNKYHGASVKVSKPIVERFIIGLYLNLGWTDREILDAFEGAGNPIHPARIKRMRAKQHENG